MAEVLVVGAGPVGLTMAGELARHGVRPRIVDRLAAPLPYCRAIGVTPRTLEVWDDIGIAREMIDAGIWITGMRSVVHGHPAHDRKLDLSDLPYSELGLPQYEVERLLTAYLSNHGVDIERGTALSGLSQTDDAATVLLDQAGGRTEQAAFRYVVGCDGAHSAVRHALRIPFEGDAFPMTFMLGDVNIDWDLPRGLALRALRLREDTPPDMFIAIPLPEPKRYRVSSLAPAGIEPVGGSDHGLQSDLRGPDLATLQAVADRLLRDRPRLSNLRWSSLFRISMRLAQRYRVGRVFIAGDAAHIHPPTGGQGMNTGIQDAYNLAWKLALVVKGIAPEALLESYEAERRPVGADVVARTRAASESYGRESAHFDRLADTQIRIAYDQSDWIADDGSDLGPTAPHAGQRAPDTMGLRRFGIGFPLRFFDLLRGPQHVLAGHFHDPTSSGKFDEFAGFVAAQRRVLGDNLQGLIVTAKNIGTAPPRIGAYHDAEQQFSAAYGNGDALFLVRPDGYIGWRGQSLAGLGEYLANMFRC